MFAKIDLVWKGKGWGEGIAAFEIHFSGWVEQAKKNVLNLVWQYECFRNKYGWRPKLTVIIVVVKREARTWSEEYLKWAWNTYQKIFDVFSKLGYPRVRHYQLWTYYNGTFYKLALDEKGKLHYEEITKGWLKRKLGV